LKESFGASTRFASSFIGATEDDPMNRYVAFLSQQIQDCPASAYFDIVGVCAETQHSIDMV
jgi:hypothetical protein